MIWSKLDPADRDVHLTSTAWEPVPPGYHNPLGPLKGRRTTAPSWGSMGSDRSVGKMIVKPGGEPLPV